MVKTMVKTIVVGVDSSQTALSAAEKAADLAEGLGAVLHVVSAYNAHGADSYATVAQGHSAVSSGSPSLADGLSGAARQIAESVAAVMRDSHPSLTVESSAGRGAPADVLVRTAEEKDAGIVVVGNKNVQGLSRVLGSVARKVAAEARCDVHIANTVSA